MKRTLATLIVLTSMVFIVQAQPPLLVTDPLTSDKIVAGEVSKRSVGGEFTAKGWRALKQNDMLVIELADPKGFEGMLEVDVTELDWEKANCQPGPDTKIHFINMFSDSKGDHHARHGGKPEDALWTLRGGCGDGGSTRYDSFKVLWASKGAKETTGSDYHEVAPKLPSGWKWDKPRYTFQVSWSKSAGTIVVKVNNQLFLSSTWKNQITPLKYVFLGKAADFRTLVGPYFSNLKVYTNFGPGGPTPTPQPNKVSLNLTSGWNLISFPVKPSNDSIGEVFSQIAGKYSAVYAFNTSTQTYQHYIPGDATSNLSKIEPGRGYWVYMQTAVSIEIQGSPASKDIKLESGWNLVGFNALNASDVASSVASISGKFSAIYSFDSVSGEYKSYIPGGSSNLAQLEPGKGYWIYANADVTWTIN
jgi:hypothetical protein